MNHKLHRRRARRAWPLLIEAAKKGEPLTYGDLCARMGLHWRAASWFLGVIQTYCSDAGLPRLQAYAVNKKSGVPGHGYLGARGRRAYSAELQRVRARCWNKTAPF